MSNEGQPSALGFRLASTSKMMPISDAQREIWIAIQQMPVGRPSYNMTEAVHLRGRLDPAALAKALGSVAARHSALRTTFVAQGEAVYQSVATQSPPEAFPLPIEDACGITGRNAERRLYQRCQEEARQPFDLRSGPLYRARLLKRGPTDHILIRTAHHLVTDGWSVGLINAELSALYAAHRAGLSGAKQMRTLVDRPVDYSDVSTTQEGPEYAARRDRQLEYWRRELAGVSPILELPVDRTMSEPRELNGASVPFTISSKLGAALRALASKERVTPHVVLMSAFGLLLGRHASQSGFCIGVPASVRNRLEWESIVGLFVNTLAMRCELDWRASCRQLLRETQNRTLTASSHRDLPMSVLTQALKPKRQPGRGPLVQVAFQLRPRTQPLELDGLQVTALRMAPAASTLDVSMWLSEQRSSAMLVGAVEYATDWFDRQTMVRLTGHYLAILEGMVNSPDRRLSAVPLLSADERRTVVRGVNATRTSDPVSTCVHDLISEQARAAPGAIALQLDDHAMTYRQLDEQANRLSRELIARGVGPESLVGLLVDRDVGFVLGVLGILKAGGAFVPIDAHSPPARVRQMLALSGVALVVTTESMCNRVDSSITAVVIRTNPATACDDAGAAPAARARLENLAYVIFTSGSTGEPKGVAVSHASLANLVHAQRRAFGITNGSNVLQFASISFDASVSELFVTLCAGATLRLAPNATRAGVDELFALLATASHATLPPALLLGLPREYVSKCLPAVDTLILAGEVVPVSLVSDCAPRVGRLLNAYGPTETTVCATISGPLKRGKRRPPIGRPIANTQAYVLDELMQLQPVGVLGELYVGGRGIARGYLGRPALTAERFVPDSFGAAAGKRLYRTGDMARLLASGEFEFRGRVDQQVKIRGVRIEPGEVENALRSYPGVRESAVVARDDGAGGQRLVAYITAAEAGSRLSEPDVRRFLRARLPDYMVPSAIVELDALPRGATGKCDLVSLPDPPGPVAQQEYVAPRSAQESALASLWSTVLGIERVGIHDDFFDLGGHSLQAMRILARLKERHQLELSLSDFFECRTVSECAARAVSSTSGGSIPVAIAHGRRNP